MVITVITKPLLYCNVLCKHCSVNHRFLSNLDSAFYVRALETIVSFVERETEERVSKIEIIWHGGEPMLAGVDFYKKTYKEVNNRFEKKGIFVNHSLQTNLIAYDSSWNEVMRDVFRWQVSTSYDFFSNLRPYDLEFFLNKLKAYQDASGDGGYVICVLNQQNKDKVLEICEIADEHKFSLKLNYLYPVGRGKQLESFGIGEYGEAIVKVFRERERFGVKIFPVDYFIEYYEGKRLELPCPITSNCVGRIFCLLPDGSIYLCGEMSDLGEGQIGKVGDREEIWFHEYFKLLEKVAVLKDECLECKLCMGGCIKQRILYGEENGVTAFCRVWKDFGKEAKKIVSKKQKLES